MASADKSLVEDDGQTAGIGGFRGSSVFGDREYIIATVAAYLGEAAYLDHGSKWYAQMATVGLNGSSVQWEHRNGSGAGVFVEVHQSDCDELGVGRTLDLVRDLKAGGFTLTRFDTYVDVIGGPRPEVTVAAFDEGQKVTRAQDRKFEDEKVHGHRQQIARIGSRSGRWYLRHYEDHEKHAQGEARWELEAHHEGAEAVAAALLAGEDLASVHWAHVVAYIDFRDRAGTPHGERAPRLDWFEDLVAATVAAIVRLPARVDHLGKRVDWVMRQVSRSLASLYVAFGPELVEEVLSRGIDRLTSQDRAMIAAAVGA
jgi:DNA relaxase NicK